MGGRRGKRQGKPGAAYDLLAPKLKAKGIGGWINGHVGLKPVLFLVSNGMVDTGEFADTDNQIIAPDDVFF